MFSSDVVKTRCGDWSPNVLNFRSWNTGQQPVVRCNFCLPIRASRAFSGCTCYQSAAIQSKTGCNARDTPFWPYGGATVVPKRQQALSEQSRVWGLVLIGHKRYQRAPAGLPLAEDILACRVSKWAEIALCLYSDRETWTGQSGQFALLMRIFPIYFPLAGRTGSSGWGSPACCFRGCSKEDHRSAFVQGQWQSLKNTAQCKPHISLFQHE